MRGGTGGWRTPAAGVLSGLLLALAFPPVEWVLLLPLALVPWLVFLCSEKSLSRALLSGFLFGLAYWCASIPWIVYVVTHYGGQSGPLGVVSLIILASILAEWPAIVAWGTVACAQPGSPLRLAVFPLLWTASEHARSFVYGGFPWNLTGHALYRHPMWLQTASIWGVHGVGALVAGVAALLAAGAVARRLRPLLFAALVVLAAGSWGAGCLALPASYREELSVILLQPNLTEEMRATPEGAAQAYRVVLGQAREAANQLPALIVIPESALPVYWERSETLRRDLAEIARLGPRILFNDVKEEPDGRYYNVARLLSAEGMGDPIYRKVHLVPFGEYVPLPRIFFFVRQISTEIGEFSAATEPAVTRSGPVAVGVGVCYEILYPSLARREVSNGANLLATISNDSWYGRAGAQKQHFAGAVLRSVENGRYLLRAAITGISGIADSRGKILSESRPNEKTTVTGTVRLRDERTVWVRWGFWIPRAADLAAAAVLLFGLARWRRGRQSTHESRLMTQDFS
ncbi:MAG TPA: apolipoprotein N-acyltransferase [Thermoanaerobaculia bacterium]